MSRSGRHRARSARQISICNGASEIGGFAADHSALANLLERHVKKLMDMLAADVRCYHQRRRALAAQRDAG